MLPFYIIVIIYNGKYIWHRQKNERNIPEHGISFEAAVDVFDDPFSVEEYCSRKNVV
ncbi:hypothetical protein AGMMS50268_41010 [Spirochaetia bacterium]|nr:hypothetical protein AGMMS50268_41010 [Spirochaetia bacterium]